MVLLIAFLLIVVAAVCAAVTRHIWLPRCLLGYTAGPPGVALKSLEGKEHSAVTAVSSLLDQHPFKGNPTGKKHWVFISHAGEQKQGSIGFLLEALQRQPLLKGRVFVDEEALQPGQREAVETIYECLQDVFVVIVWLSEDFISKRYPMEELQLLMHWQQQGSSVQVLPVWYHITYEEASAVLEYYKAAAASGNPESAETDLPKHLSRARLAANSMARSSQKDQKDRLQQWTQDLKQLLSITGLRKDKVWWEHEMMDKVVAATVNLLSELGKMQASLADLHLMNTLKEGMQSEYRVPDLMKEYLPGSRAWRAG